METTTKVGISVSVIALLSLSFFMGVKLTDDNVYYCKDLSVIYHCVSVSSTKLTCNYVDESSVKRGKRCNSLWEKVVNDIKLQDKVVNTQNVWLCNYEGCVPK